MSSFFIISWRYGKQLEPVSMEGRDSISGISKIERSERLGLNQVRQTKPITPARRMSNANSACLYLKERFSPVTAEEYVLSSWLLLFCFVYSSKDKTKSDAMAHLIKCRRKHLGRAAKHDKVQTSLNRNTHKPSCSAC